MCQAKVYLGNQEVARDVVWLEPVPDGVRIETFFGGLQILHGRIQRVDFLTHRVSLEPLEEEPSGTRKVVHPAAALD